MISPYPSPFSGGPAPRVSTACSPRQAGHDAGTVQEIWRVIVAIYTRTGLIQLAINIWGTVRLNSIEICVRKYNLKQATTKQCCLENQGLFDCSLV